MVDKETCPICEKERESKEFVTHHISYNPEETMRVCRSCHRKVHMGIIRNDLKPELTKIQVDVEEDVNRKIEMAKVRLKHDQGERINKSKIVQRALHWLVERGNFEQAAKNAYKGED